jgi:hypothetical protein
MNCVDNTYKKQNTTAVVLCCKNYVLNLLNILSLSLLQSVLSLNFINLLSCIVEADLHMGRGNVCKQTGILGVHIM